MHIQLLIPNLIFSRPAHAKDIHPLFELELPSLSLLLDNAEETESFLDEEYSLAKACGLNMDPPYGVAAISANLEGLPGKKGCWIRADPVRMQVGQESIYCLGQQDLNLKPEEVQSLISGINSLLHEEGLSIEVGNNPMHWYIQTEQQDMQTIPLNRVIARSILEYLPKGEAAKSWQKRLTEIQMLFKGHAVNLARQKAGLATVDSLWLWGEGRYPKNLLARKDVLYGDNNYAQAVAAAANLPYQNMPEKITEVLDSPYQKIMLVTDQLSLALAAGNLPFWQKQVMQLEHSVFLPLLLALKNKKIDQIVLDFCSGSAFVINRRGLRKWWQKPDSLQSKFQAI